MPSLYQSVIYLALALLVIVNAAGVFMVVLQLPGTWLMLLATGLVAWWQPNQIGWAVLAVMLLLAVMGELVEALLASAKARRAGGSRRGALLAIVGGIVGAVVGTILLPVPVVGTLTGACVGAGGGALAGDRLAGRSWSRAWTAGAAAARGRLWATVLKLIIALAMWAIATVAVFVR
jgi:uncharacterized protein YqgC (DUF456 family)